MGCALQCQHGHSMVMGWCCTGASWCRGGASNGILQAGAYQGGATSQCDEYSTLLHKRLVPVEIR